MTKSQGTSKAGEMGWADEFDIKWDRDLLYRAEATSSRVPINTKEGVADLGTMIGYGLRDLIKDFISEALHRKDEEWKEKVRGLRMEHQEPDIQAVQEVVALNEGNVDFREVMDFEWMTLKYKNQAIDEFNKKVDELLK